MTDVMPYVPDGDVLTDFFWDRSRLSIIQGPIESGTSTACCHKMWLQACEQEPDPSGLCETHWVVVGQTYPQLKDTAVKTWLRWFDEGRWGRMTKSEPMEQIIERPSPNFRGAQIKMIVKFLAIPDEDTARAMLPSHEYTGFWANEVQNFDKGVILELLSRTPRIPAKQLRPDGTMFQATWGGGFCDMNAPTEGHWIPYMRGDIPIPAEWTEDQRREFEKPDDWRFFVQPPGLLEEVIDGRVFYKPNPAAENQKWITLPYIEKAKANPREWIDEKIMNKVSVNRRGKPVYPTFFAADHVAKDDVLPVEGVQIIVGMDFGRYPAAAFCQCINGTWYVLSELIGVDESASLFAPKVRRHLALHYPAYNVVFYGDPRGADRGQADETTAYDIFAAHGMRVLPATTDNNPEMRRSAMSSVLMRRGGMKVSKACMTIRIGMGGGYHFRKDKATNLSTDKPMKNIYSHVCEALENAILGGGEGDAIIRPASRATPQTSKIRRHKVNLRRTG